MNSTANNVKPPVLTCWKDIASYMGKGVRTVQRWEQDFGLPVRRHLGSNKKAVLARPSDLDAWVALRCGSRTPMPLVPTGKLQDSVMRLAALSAQIQTARQLRDSNRLLLGEFRLAMLSLQQQILTMQSEV
jgi:predicted DNA-binding transcriptional regulator AlpA